MRAVNLLPSERPGADPRSGKPVAGGGGALTTTKVAIGGGVLTAVVAGAVGFMFVGARGDVASHREALASVQQQVAEAQTRAAARAQTQAQQAAASTLPSDIKAQLDAFNMAAAQRIQWDLLLSDVSRVMPQGTWLSSLTLQGAQPADATSGSPAAATAGAPTGFVASGFAFSQPVVARLMQRLALVPMLSDITLQRSEKSNVGADEAFQFTLSANVRLDGAS
jgi:Tfp pilus assembly protein PilN